MVLPLFPVEMSVNVGGTCKGEVKLCEIVGFLGVVVPRLETIAMVKLSGRCTP